MWVIVLLENPQTTDTALPDFAMMLMPGSCYSAAIVILSWVTGSLSQPATKRAAAIALINAVCNTPNSMDICSSFYILY
jgi:hypothetical protein